LSYRGRGSVKDRESMIQTPRDDDKANIKRKARMVKGSEGKTRQGRGRGWGLGGGEGKVR